MKKITEYFSKFEIMLWCSSVLFIIGSFFMFDRQGYITLFASLIGVTSLIFNAKGNPVGQLLMIVFSIIYGIISFSFNYYGEMITYLGMTGPMALFALIVWLKNPFKGNRAEVEVNNNISKKEVCFLILLTAVVTVIFYFILDYFNTRNIFLSSLSVTTSFVAVYLTFRRSPYFAVAYACNDAVLIALWIMATLKNVTYLSVIICFLVFLFNDIYGFVNWKRMEKLQRFYQKNSQVVG